MVRLLLAVPFGIAALTLYVIARTYRPELVDRIAARSRTAYGLFLVATGGFLFLSFVITITYLSAGREAAAGVIDILSIIALIPLFLVFLIALAYAFTVIRVRLVRGMLLVLGVSVLAGALAPSESVAGAGLVTVVVVFFAGSLWGLHSTRLAVRRVPPI